MAATPLKKRAGSGQVPRIFPDYDISIVLNLHDEARYFRRTLLSLEDAVRYARQFDITFELVVVLDNADEATARIAEDYDYAVFDACQILHVRNGSLGLSRNDGIEAARGEYIATADADDLLGFDYFQRLYLTARSAGPRAVAVPEYYFGFGIIGYIWKFWPHGMIGNGAFFEGHPYISRILFRREIWDKVKFADASLKGGYAYEDWHFNCECLAVGCSIEIAEGAVLFYRQRPGSLLRRADTETTRLIPPSRFFHPATYMKLTWMEFSGKKKNTSEPTFTREEFLELPGMTEIVAAANRIDPAISLGILRYKPASSNFCTAGPAAHAYFKACELLAGGSFTDVLLVPFLTKGGAEKYILSVLGALHGLDPEAKVLVIATQALRQHDWIDRLPEGSVFLDLHALEVAGLTAPMIEKIALRLIQHVPGIRRIHMKNCEFVDSFARTYLEYLRDFDTTFYHFCDPRVEVGGLTFINGQCFDLVSHIAPHLTRIVSDHAKDLGFIGDMVGEEVPLKARVIYASCDLPPAPERDAEKPPARRIFWASRIDEQKRPRLLAKIARAVAATLPDVSFDAYGSSVYGVIGPEVFEGEPNLAYSGEFSDFGDLGVERYDAMIYTAAFDGLPNIVLEAMAAGLPVITPDVGGIGEAISPKTGYLIGDDPDEEVLVDRFVEAVKSLYDDWEEAVRRGAEARRLVAERHSENAFLSQVEEAFGLKKQRRAKTPRLESSLSKAG